MDEKTIRQTAWRSGAPADAIAHLLELLDAERKKSKRGRAHAGRLAVIEHKARQYMKDIDELLHVKEPDYENAARYGRGKLMELSRISAETSDAALKNFLVETMADAISQNLTKKDITRFVRERLDPKR